MWWKEKASTSTKHEGLRAGKREKQAKQRIFISVPILPRQVSRLMLASTSLAIQPDLAIRIKTRENRGLWKVYIKPVCNFRGFSNLGQEAARLNPSLGKYQPTLPFILGFSFTGGRRFIKASKSTFMFSTTTFNSSTLSLVLSINKI